MSEEEKTPTTGIENPSDKNGMGGVSENSGGVSPEEPPKRKRGRPPKKPGEPKKVAGTIGEYATMHPTVGEHIHINTKGQSTIYPSEMSPDEVVAREIDKHRETMALPRVNTNNLEEVQGRYVVYMQLCQKYGRRMTVGGFAECLGVPRQTLERWASGVLKRPQPVVDFLNYVIASICADLEERMASNKINPVSGIFLLKQSGYKDNVDLTVNAATVSEKSEEELAAEYLNSIPTVDD